MQVFRLCVKGLRRFSFVNFTNDWHLIYTGWGVRSVMGEAFSSCMLLQGIVKLKRSSIFSGLVPGIFSLVVLKKLLSLSGSSSRGLEIGLKKCDELLSTPSVFLFYFWSYYSSLEKSAASVSQSHPFMVQKACYFDLIKRPSLLMHSLARMLNHYTMSSGNFNPHTHQIKAN